jgi:hypothetical protein
LGAAVYIAAIAALGGVGPDDVRLLGDLARTAPPGPPGSLT